jgi:hypothetical protein
VASAGSVSVGGSASASAAAGSPNQISPGGFGNEWNPRAGRGGFVGAGTGPTMGADHHAGQAGEPSVAKSNLAGVSGSGASCEGTCTIREATAGGGGSARQDGGSSTVETPFGATGGQVASGGTTHSATGDGGSVQAGTGQTPYDGTGGQIASGGTTHGTSGGESAGQGGSFVTGGTTARSGGSAGQAGRSTVEDCAEHADICLDPADAGSGRCCSDVARLMAYVRPTNIDSVLFRKAVDNKIYELTRDSSPLWSPWNLADVLGRPFTALSNPFGYVRASGSPAVVFRGEQGRLYEYGGISVAPFWGLAALTKAGGPIAVGDPIAFLRSDMGENLIDAVAFRDDRGHILELTRVFANDWILGDIAKDAASDPYAYATAEDTEAVVYRGTDDHVHQLERTSGVLELYDLTQDAQAPLAAGEPRGFAHFGEYSAVVYRDTSGHIHQLYRARGAERWNHVDLTFGLQPAASDPFPYLRSDRADAIVYLGMDRHVDELTFYKGGWYWGDLTNITGCEKATGMPFGYVRSDRKNAVIFWSVDQRRIIEIAGEEGGWASRNLLAQIPDWP